MANSTTFLTLVSIAILGTSGCTKDRQPAAGAASAPPAGAQQLASETSKKDVFRIYDEFIAAEAVAKACGATTRELEDQHNKNFLVVTHAVRNDLTNKHGKPESSLNEFLRGHDEIIRTRTLEMLKTHPCDSTDAKVVIHRYKLQSQWKI
jgi:hypothetical protein